MPLMPCRCPQCGGELKVDSEKKTAICEYCDTPFIIDKAIHNYNINNAIINHADITISDTNIDNLIILANEELKLYCDDLKLERQRKILEYANRILEADATNAQGWLLKLKSHLFCDNINAISEITACGENAIKYSKDDNIAHEVYITYIMLIDNYIANNKTIFLAMEIPKEVLLTDVKLGNLYLEVIDKYINSCAEYISHLLKEGCNGSKNDSIYLNSLKDNNYDRNITITEFGKNGLELLVSLLPDHQKYNFVNVYKEKMENIISINNECVKQQNEKIHRENINLYFIIFIIAYLLYCYVDGGEFKLYFFWLSACYNSFCYFYCI